MRTVCLVVCVVFCALVAQTATITVNTTGNGNARDGALSLTEAILLSNGPDKGGIAVADMDAVEQTQVVGVPGNGDQILFNIQGAGPHSIVVPPGEGDGGFPAVRSNGTTIDGYSQPGSSPNTNSIKEPNNAVIQIILDGTNGAYNGDVWGIIGTTGTDVTFKGLSILDADGDASGITFINGVPLGMENAQGGQIAGCWIGVHPDGVTVTPGGELGIYFGGEEGFTGGGHVVGTNGDGVDDRAEFNVIVGYGQNIYGEGTSDLRISGNFVGVLPSGTEAALPEPDGQGLEGALYQRVLIGTDSDGVADEDEGNLFGGLKDGINIWDGAPIFDTVIAGNVYGVGIDGTALPITNFVRGRVWVNMRVGSNLDGVRDEIESNVIANTQNTFWKYREPDAAEYDARISIRGNRMSGNEMDYDGLEHSFQGDALMIADSSELDLVRPVIDPSTDDTQLKGSVPLHPGNAEEDRVITEIIVDLYIADPGTLPDQPQGAEYVGSFVVNGPNDQDPATDKFDFDITGLVTQSGNVSLTVTSNLVGAPSETAYEDLYVQPGVVERGVDTSPFSMAHEIVSTSVGEWAIH